MMKTPQGTAYEIHGKGKPETLILIHGLGLTRRTWDDFLPALSADYQVICYDLLGHGESDLPDKTPSLTSLAAQLSELLATLQIEKAHLIGFSLGGMINRRMAMDYPDRVASLIILNSPHERGAEQQALVEQRAKDTSQGGAEATIETTLERWFTPQFRASNPDKTNWVRETVLANDPQNYADHRFVLANGVVELIRPTPALASPTLVMTCQHDSGSNVAMSEAIASEIAGAELVIVPELQHLGLIEQPDLFIKPILTFLETIIANQKRR